METLKTKDQVLFYDGKSILELTTVISEDDSTVKLSNGVICSKEPIKKSGMYKRKDHMKGSKFQGWIKKYEGSLVNIYQAYLFLKKSKNQIKNDLSINLTKIKLDHLVNGSVNAEEVLKISKSLEKIIRKCNSLVQ